MKTYKSSVMRRFLRDMINGEIIGASDGGRYGVSWLANYATELREAHGLIIKSIPKGQGLKHYYVIRNKERARKVLAMMEKEVKKR